MEYSQLKECMIESMHCLLDGNSVTVEGIRQIQYEVITDKYAEGLVAGLFVGFCSSNGLLSELQASGLSMNDQLKELIEYMTEFKTGE